MKAWDALDAVWAAMARLNTAEEALSHMRQLACILESLALTSGWTKLNFPIGLSMAVVLHFQRYCLLYIVALALITQVSFPRYCT